MLDDRLSKEENAELTCEDVYDIHDIFDSMEDALEVMSRRNPKRLISDIANDIKEETFAYLDRRDDLKYKTCQYFKFECSNRIAIVEYY